MHIGKADNVATIPIYFYIFANNLFFISFVEDWTPKKNSDMIKKINAYLGKAERSIPKL